jgi:hypothetical protein
MKRTAGFVIKTVLCLAFLFLIIHSGFAMNHGGGGGGGGMGGGVIDPPPGAALNQTIPAAINPNAQRLNMDTSGLPKRTGRPLSIV